LLPKKLVGEKPFEFSNTLLKVVDFSGYIHFRHPLDLGGVAFSFSVLWAQIFPFVTLQIYEENNDSVTQEDISLYLTGFLLLWLILNAAFLCTVDLRFLGTFFDTHTAPQDLVHTYKTSTEDFQRYDAVFTNRPNFTKPIHGEVKKWVSENIEIWKSEKPDWFHIEMIDEKFLPRDVFDAEGGKKRRRRSSVSMREVTSFPVPVPTSKTSRTTRNRNEKWKLLSENVYETWSANHKSNILHINRIFDVENKEIFAPLLERCPNFKIILSYILEDKFGFRVQNVKWSSNMKDWS